MKTLANPYIPINCSYYDKLEAWATLRREVEILYLNLDGTEALHKGRIVDFFIRDEAEYMKLADGAEIRLDYLLSVNGEEVPNAC